MKIKLFTVCFPLQMCYIMGGWNTSCIKFIDLMYNKIIYLRIQIYFENICLIYLLIYTYNI